MKKFKSLQKKIRRLEARLQKGEKKLARLKQKLGAAETRAAAKPKGKSTGVTQKASNASGSIDKNKKRSPLKTGVKPAANVQGSGSAKSAKRKLNLTPERREQLAAAMRARWAAKRAAAGANTQQSSGSAPGDAS
jgi:predicted RNase H-like nuclease (RuvC/YqgF family)